MKHKSYREKYFEDYTAVKEPAGNRKGYRMVYRYTGLWVVWRSEKLTLAAFRKILAVWEVMSVLLFVISASADTAVNSCRPASGFGILALVPWALELSGVVRFCAGGAYVKERSYSEIDQSIRVGCLFRILLGGLSVLIAVIATLIAGNFTLADGAFAAGSVISLALSYAVRHAYLTLLVERYHNEDGRPGKRC